MCCWFFVVVFAHFIRCFFYVCVFKWILSRKCCFSHLVHLQMKHYSIVAHLIYEVNYSLGKYVYILEASNFRLNQDCCGITVKKNFTSVLYWLLYFFNKRFGLFLSLFLLFSPLFFIYSTHFQHFTTCWTDVHFNTHHLFSDGNLMEQTPFWIRIFYESVSKATIRTNHDWKRY